MGSEYRLGTHDEAKTPSGPGISLMVYEMSGSYDVYVDLPIERVDMDAWPADVDCDASARVDLWNDVDPIDLFAIGLQTLAVASYHIPAEELTALKQNAIEAIAKLTSR
jgi:hypothetical protein